MLSYKDILTLTGSTILIWLINNIYISVTHESVTATRSNRNPCRTMTHARYLRSQTDANHPTFRLQPHTNLLRRTVAHVDVTISCTRTTDDATQSYLSVDTATGDIRADYRHPISNVTGPDSSLRTTPATTLMRLKCKIPTATTEISSGNIYISIIIFTENKLSYNERNVRTRRKLLTQLPLLSARLEKNVTTFSRTVGRAHLWNSRCKKLQPLCNHHNSNMT